MDDPALVAASERYLDSVFGPGFGGRHSAFLARIENPSLRGELHRYHLREADESQLTIEENYLLGMCVLCATRSYGPAAMFAKTLRHRGVGREKILEAVARLSMWVGGIAAAEATAHIQQALKHYDAEGLASLDAWFPTPEHKR